MRTHPEGARFDVDTFSLRIAWHSPEIREWTANRNRTGCKA
jgi:hypothetical protein